MPACFHCHCLSFSQWQAGIFYNGNLIMSVPLLKTLQWLLSATGILKLTHLQVPGRCYERVKRAESNCTPTLCECQRFGKPEKASLTPVTVIISDPMWAQMLAFLRRSNGFYVQLLAFKRLARLKDKNLWGPVGRRAVRHQFGIWTWSFKIRSRAS